MNLEVINKGFTRVLGSKALIVKAHSPELLLGFGIAGVITTTVLACRATLKVEGIVDDAKTKLDKINTAALTIPIAQYSDQDRKKDLVIVYTQTATKIVTLYGPPVLLGAASIACIMGGHNILKSRNVALVAAYKTLDKGFRAYRRRVVDEYGEDKDYMLAHDLRAETLTTVSTTGKGKSKVETTTAYLGDPNNIGPYAKFFDECSPEWDNNPEYNQMFLRAQQNYFNNLLQSRGAVFLNEVYDNLGIPRTSAGAVVGWKMGGNGDNFIDFGIFDGSAIKREFINGLEKSILLDFNVDGVMYDLI